MGATNSHKSGKFWVSKVSMMVVKHVIALILYFKLSFLHSLRTASIVSSNLKSVSTKKFVCLLSCSFVPIHIIKSAFKMLLITYLQLMHNTERTFSKTSFKSNFLIRNQQIEHYLTLDQVNLALPSSTRQS